MSARERLAQGLIRRVPTWDVAQSILCLGLNLPRSLAREVSALAHERPRWFMADDFDRVVPATRQIARFADLWPELGGLAAGEDLDPDALRVYVMAGMTRMRMGDRDPEAVLASKTRLPGSVRKRVRFLKRLADRADRLEDVLRLRHAQMQAKSRLAYMIDPTRCDDLTLAFCAYLAARANRRSLFMVGSQSRAKDQIVEGLFDLLKEDPEADWLSVAMVYPTHYVIERLDAGERGRLIGLFHSQMATAAKQLGLLWPTLPERMRAEMVVVRGIDSSRWNAYAGALNTMRSAWINAVLAAGLDEVLDGYLPGKTPRLMASDVAWMYRGYGQDLHEDTRMFGLLARPWDVVNGVARQGYDDVLKAAEAAGVDALTTGWVGPRAPVSAERPAPEPALVHGVVVDDPELARTLRRCGVFSGKRLRHLDELLDAAPLERSVAVREDGALIPTASGYTRS